MTNRLTVLRTPEGIVGPAVVTLGTFDGVHAGHQGILRSVVARARATGSHSLVVTFDPHPLEVVDASRAPRLLETPDERLEQMESLGIGYVYQIPFDDEIARQSPADFLESHLFAWLDIEEIIVGYDFHFGRARSGDARFLAETGEKRGFQVEVVPPIRLGNAIVSSTRIRGLVDEGKVEEAALLLGRPFRVSGTVVAGDGRGRKLGFPTANIELPEAQAKKISPARGVYAVRVHGPFEEPADGMLNHGVRPTFDGHRDQLEVHIFDQSQDLYGVPLTIEFIARVRDEVRFEGAQALRSQLEKDEIACRNALCPGDV